MKTTEQLNNLGYCISLIDCHVASSQVYHVDLRNIVDARLVRATSCIEDMSHKDGIRFLKTLKKEMINEMKQVKKYIKAEISRM